jgi:hypothetical protein
MRPAFDPTLVIVKTSDERPLSTRTRLPVEKVPDVGGLTLRVVCPALAAPASVVLTFANAPRRVTVVTPPLVSTSIGG